MTTARGAAVAGTAPRGAGAAWPLPLPLPTSGVVDAWATAWRRRSARFSVKVWKGSPTAGLGTRSKAPSASASTARAPWAGEKALTTMTGTSGAPFSFSARSTPRPSRPGIARSRVMASGRVARHCASASSPSRAVPTTSKPAAPSAPPRTVRMNGESSATTMRGAGAIGG